MCPDSGELWCVRLGTGVQLEQDLRMAFRGQQEQLGTALGFLATSTGVCTSNSPAISGGLCVKRQWLHTTICMDTEVPTLRRTEKRWGQRREGAER